MKKILYLVFIVSAMSCSSEIEKKPNFLFLFTDDQSFRTINELGYHELITPTMDELVRTGTTFTHAYNMGGWNGAICVASRAMIISGQYIWDAQQISREYEGNQALEKTWPRLMNKGGYKTYMTGKWHIQANPDSIFSVTSHIRPGMPNDFEEGYNRPLSKTDTLWQPWNKNFEGFWKGGMHWSEVIANDVISYIDDAAELDKNFFMYAAFNAPHDPRQSPKEYVDMYPMDSISIPESFLPEYPWKDEMGCPATLRDERLAPFPRTPYAVQKHRQEYYAIISHLDAQLSKILEHLKAKNLYHNTYIILTSDHGLSVGEHGLIGKQSMFDHSIRVPFIVCGPGIEKNKRTDLKIYLQDVMPTVLEYAGIEIPDFVQFKSLVPILKGTYSEAIYNKIYGSYKSDRQRMIIQDDHKLILYPYANKMLLYDLERDPFELQDLSEDENYQSIKINLYNSFKKLQIDYRDTLDIDRYFKNFGI